MRTAASMLAFMLVLITQILYASDTLAQSSQLVDINGASAQELADGLPGIGPAKAARIVAWRESNGVFKTVDQLQEVKGIGPKTVEKLRALVKVGSLSDEKRTQLDQNLHEDRVRSAITRVVVAAQIAAQPDSTTPQPVRPWYRRSAMEILRTH